MESKRERIRKIKEEIDENDGDAKKVARKLGRIMRKQRGDLTEETRESLKTRENETWDRLAELERKGEELQAELDDISSPSSSDPEENPEDPEEEKEGSDSDEDDATSPDKSSSDDDDDGNDQSSVWAGWHNGWSTTGFRM